MPKYPSEKNQIDDLKNFIQLTWEVVRRNPDYRSDYLKFLQNYGLSPEDVKEDAKEGVNPDGSRTIPIPGQQCTYYLDPEKGRFLPQDDIEPDPERCNLPFMKKKWGFFCDPDESTHQGSPWSGVFLTKAWRKRTKSGKHFMMQPLQVVESNLLNLPGVLKVDKYPKLKLDHKESEPVYRDGEEIGERPKYIWQDPETFDLSVTINLQAPAKLIRYAFESLVAVCQAEFGTERKIEWDYIKKCLEIYDLHQQGHSYEEIVKLVPLIKYRLKQKRETENRTPEMIQADNEVDGEFQMISQIKSYIKKVGDMISKGAII